MGKIIKIVVSLPLCGSGQGQACSEVGPAKGVVRMENIIYSLHTQN